MVFRDEGRWWRLGDATATVQHARPEPPHAAAPTAAGGSRLSAAAAAATAAHRRFAAEKSHAGATAAYRHFAAGGPRQPLSRPPAARTAACVLESRAEVEGGADLLGRLRLASVRGVAVDGGAAAVGGRGRWEGSAGEGGLCARPPAGAAGGAAAVVGAALSPAAAAAAAAPAPVAAAAAPAADWGRVAAVAMRMACPHCPPDSGKLLGHRGRHVGKRPAGAPARTPEAERLYQRRLQRDNKRRRAAAPG